MKKQSPILISQFIIAFILCLFFLDTQAQSLEGIYYNKNTGNNFELKVIKVNDTLYYSELSDITSSDRMRSIMAIFNDNKKSLTFLFSDAFMSPLNLRKVNEDTLYIEPVSISKDFKFFSGKYMRDKNEKNITPSYSNFYRDNYYDLYRIDKPSNLTMYTYPVVSGKRKNIQLKKGAKIKDYANLYDYKTNEEGLYYLCVQQEGKTIYGWIKPTDFSKFHFLWKVRNGEKWIKNE